MDIILTSPQQLRELINECLNNKPVEAQQLTTKPEKQYAYSIREAANWFHVSTVTFQDWKNHGFVKCVQHGRKLIIDIPGTLELLSTKKGTL
jgi:hypothetical protein